MRTRPARPARPAFGLPRVGPALTALVLAGLVLSGCAEPADEPAGVPSSPAPAATTSTSPAGRPGAGSQAEPDAQSVEAGVTEAEALLEQLERDFQEDDAATR